MTYLNNNSLLNSVLEAREERASLRKTFAAKKILSLSLSLNIPGYPKSNPLLQQFFFDVKKELETFLKAHGVLQKEDLSRYRKDAAGDFFITGIDTPNLSAQKLKELTEIFETTHPQARLIDVDIFSSEGIPVSSGKAKLCYFCNEHPAVFCMRKKLHDYKDIRQKIKQNVSKYLEEKRTKNIASQLASYALRSLIYEVSLSPKPGLVDFYDSGIHRDMHFFTFIDSSAALSNSFMKFATLGCNYTKPLSEALPEIRKIGLRAEEIMFQTTGGINTQKGLIFLMGISLFSVAYVLKEQEPFTFSKFRKTVQTICTGLVKKELSANTAQTHGEKVFAKYGKRIGGGARYEAESGFATIFDFAMPVLESQTDFLQNPQLLQQTLRKVLLTLMSENNDTNILFRSDLETLKQLKNKSLQAIDSEEKYQELTEFCKKKKISPGGSADLLAISLFLYFVKQNKDGF
ncbi:MAG: hypothetical protein CSB06_01690 [Bacteroidia bacterium]|nr:MAG: hypothetical protein CSB06_01690 [Bacteroidia bacterium]